MEDNIFDKVHDIDLKKTMEESYIDYRFPCPPACPGRFEAGTEKNFILND